MPLTDSTTYPEAEIEALISALHGVMATSVVLDEAGHVDEIHVLAEQRMHPKQMVRNIESALSAGLGILVDRRAISVAQVRAEHHGSVVEAISPDPHSPGQDPWDEALPAEPEPEPEHAGAVGRFIFMGYDARTRPDLEATCRVSIRLGNSVFSGSASGPSTQLGRAQAAAAAVFAAIATATASSSIGLEGVTLVESHGRTYILVAAHVAAGRTSVPLTGVAALQKSPEEAAILAALQATNRWNAFNG
jgi:hypothetical protein